MAGFGAKIKAFAKVADSKINKALDSLETGPWEKWYSIYEDAGETYDLRLKRDKAPGEVAKTGIFKLVYQNTTNNKHVTVEGKVQYADTTGHLIPASIFVIKNNKQADQKDTEYRFSDEEEFEGFKVENGYVLCKKSFSSMSIIRVANSDPPTIELSYSFPTLDYRITGDIVVGKEPEVTVEVYKVSNN